MYVCTVSVEGVCNKYIYSILHILTIVFPDKHNVEYLPIFHGSYPRYAYREISAHIPWKLFHGLVIFFPSRHARSVVKSIFHCYVNIKRI